MHSCGGSVETTMFMRNDFPVLDALLSATQMGRASSRETIVRSKRIKFNDSPTTPSFAIAATNASSIPGAARTACAASKSSVVGSNDFLTDETADADIDARAL